MINHFHIPKSSLNFLINCRKRNMLQEPLSHVLKQFVFKQTKFILSFSSFFQDSCGLATLDCFNFWRHSQYNFTEFSFLHLNQKWPWKSGLQ